MASGNKGRYILLISIHGLIRGHDLELGRDADTGGQTKYVVDLARALRQFDAWVRLHYVYPYPHVDDVIPLMADGLITPYLDIPFQHASANVLKAMKQEAATRWVPVLVLTAWLQAQGSHLRSSLRSRLGDNPESGASTLDSTSIPTSPATPRYIG